MMTMFLKKKIPKRIMTVYVTVNVEKKLKVFVGKTARKRPDLPVLNHNSAKVVQTARNRARWNARILAFCPRKTPNVLRPEFDHHNHHITIHCSIALGVEVAANGELQFSWIQTSSPSTLSSVPVSRRFGYNSDDGF